MKQVLRNKTAQQSVILLCKTAAERLALAASGRDADNARKRNPAEALKTAKKRGDSHLSAARCVSLLDICKTH
jgi:hypothetical protein